MILFLLIFALSAGVVEAQVQTEPLFPAPLPDAGRENQMRSAASRFEAAGQYEPALNIYRSLRGGNTPSRYDFIYYQGELRCLLGLKRWEEAELLVRKEMMEAGNDMQKSFHRGELLADLGRVYLQMRKDSQAIEQFNLAVAFNPTDANMYRIVSNVYLQERREDEALEVLKRGDKRLGGGNLTRDIAYLYQMMMDYASAAEYYIEYLRAQPAGFAMVERALYGFPESADSQKAVEEVLRANLDFPLALKLLTGLLFSQRRYDEALLFVMQTDTEGKELYAFAAAAAQENRCDLALRGYSAALSKRGADAMKAEIYLGMADCHYKSGQDTAAVMMYRRITEEYKFSGLAETALFKLGVVYLQDFHQADSAALYFQKVRTSFPKGKNSGEAGKYLAECSIYRGQVLEAAEQLQSIIDREGRQDAELRGKAMLLMGRCLFWAGKTDSAMAVWERVGRSLPGTEAANDALTDMLCFKEASPAELKEFGAAWLLLYRGDYINSADRFRKLADDLGGTVLGARSIVEMSVAGEKFARGFEAADYLGKYVEKYPKSKMIDEVYYRLGELYLNLGEVDKAKYWWEELLVECPNSARAGVVRGKVKG